jgi:hypothetical protein
MPRADAGAGIGGQQTGLGDPGGGGQHSGSGGTRRQHGGGVVAVVAPGTGQTVVEDAEVTAWAPAEVMVSATDTNAVAASRTATRSDPATTPVLLPDVFRIFVPLFHCIPEHLSIVCRRG